MSARSKRELKETAIQEPLFFVSFFFVTPAIFRLLNKGFPSITARLQTLVDAKASQEKINQTGRYAALSFLGAYLANILITIGIVNWTNQMTRNSIKEDVQALHRNQKITPSLSVKSLP